MSSTERIARAIDELVVSTRLSDLGTIARAEKRARVAKVHAVIKSLGSGHFLIGCGPYNTGVIKIGRSEIVLGRTVSPLEKSADSVIDYSINDAVYLAPHEVSRVHGAVWVESMNAEQECCRYQDKGSSCGSFINGLRVGAEDIPNPATLESMDVLWLGGSGSTAYLYAEL